MCALCFVFLSVCKFACVRVCVFYYVVIYVVECMLPFTLYVCISSLLGVVVFEYYV